MPKKWKILPRYAIVPIVTCFVLNIIVYWGNRLFTSDMYHYDFSIIVDEWIPLFTPMVSIYFLSYVFWVIGYIVIGRESREVCYEVCSGEQIAKLICLVFYFVIPTTLQRPEITGEGIFDVLTRMLYVMDSPDNLFPSIHCLESWVCFRGAMRCKKVGKTYKVVMFILAIAVFASTVMTKQHLFVDIIGGIVVFEIGLFLARKWNVSRVYYAIERKMVRDERA